MDLGIRIIATLLFSFFLTIILLYIKNRSNLPSLLVIPVLVAFLTKYVLGDWDKGFQWTLFDITYWISIIGVSYGTVYLLSLPE